MDDSWEAISGDNRSAKDLFKLIVKRGEVRVTDAPKILGAERKDVEEWTKTLIEKRYAQSVGEGEAAVLKPTDDILGRICGYRERFQSEELKDGSIIAEELSRERKMRIGLQQQVKDLNHIISGLNDDLVAENKARQQLEEAVEALKKGNLSAERLAEFETQLQRERTERKRLEDIIRRRDDESVQVPTIPQAPKAQPPKEKEPPAKQEAAVSWYKSGVKEPAAEEATAKEEAPIAAVAKNAPLNQEETPAPHQDTVISAAQASPDRDTTELLYLLSKKGKASMKDISRELNADEKTVEGWITELGEYGAVEAVRHLFGNVDFMLKKGVSVDEVRDKIGARRVRQEMQRLRGAR
ncbi:MAG: hypothetical protein V1875_00865 [Candidatus Altiarchaeota archaeon]